MTSRLLGILSEQESYANQAALPPGSAAFSLETNKFGLFCFGFLKIWES